MNVGVLGWWRHTCKYDRNFYKRILLVCLDVRVGVGVWRRVTGGGGASLEVEARRWRWARVTPPRWFGQVQAVRESARRVCL